MIKRKLMALGLAGCLMAMPVAVFADEATTSPAAGNTTGTGNVEGVVDKDIFKVELPTIAANDTTFNFILDPQSLLVDTSGAAYSGATFSGTGLYFKNVSDSGATYSATSDSLTVTNKGTVGVDVSLTATVSTADGLTFESTDTDLNTKTTNSIYLALKTDATDNNTAVVDNATLKATISDSLTAAPAGAYKVVYDTTNKVYSYDLDSNFSGSFDSLTFNLTGACNTNTAVDWSALENVAPSVNVAWTLTEHVDIVEPEPVEAICVLQDSTFWIGPDASAANVAFDADAVISDVKVNGTTCAYTMTNNYVTISWANIVAAGEDSATSWTITLVADDQAYTVTYPTPTTTP